MEVFTTLVTAALAFTATNVDDIVLLTLYFGSLSEALRPVHIVVGQYLGFALLVALSLLGVLGALVVPQQYIGFLGVLPILLGVLAFVRRGDDDDDEGVLERVTGAAGKGGRGLLAPQTFAVAGVTAANGSDNLSIYIPLFASTPRAETLVIVLVFFVLVAVWCLLGARLARVPFVARTISKYGAVLVPFVLIGLGVFILVETGALGVLLSLVAR